MLWKIAAICLALLSTAVAQDSKRVQDDSDWWSVLRTDEASWDRADRIRTPASTLQIAGLSLVDPHLPDKIKRKLGPVVEVSRGDASTGRHQYCYVSPRDPRERLIFEFGEVDSIFYLFEDGRSWNGSEYCRPSKLVSDGLSTPSGLRLGVSILQIQRILGKPTLKKDDQLIYLRSIKVKATPEEIKRARADAPDMSEEEFQRDYSYWDFSTYIEARFREGKLYYLAISQSETL